MFRYYKVALLSFVIFLFSGNIFGKTVTLNEAVQLAKKNSELMALSKSEFEKTKHQVKEAWSTVLPKVNLEARYQRFLQDPVFFTQTFPIKNQFESSVNVQQLVYAFGKIDGALSAAKIGTKIGRIKMELTKADVEFLAQTSYFSALFYKEQLKIIKQSLRNSIENLEILQNKFSSGRPPKGDLLRLQSDVEVRKTQVKLAESNYNQATLSLSRVIGIKSEFELGSGFNHDLIHFKKKQLDAKVENTKPRIDLLRQTADLMKIGANIEKANRYPTLSAFGSFIYSGGSISTLNSNDLNSYSLVGLQLQWNIWNGGTVSAKYKQALEDYAQAEITYQKGQKDLQLDIDKALINYNSLIEGNSSSKQAVKLAEQSFKITQKRFKTGQSSVTELNSAESALTQTRVQLSSNIFQAHMALAELESLLMVSPGGLR